MHDRLDADGVIAQVVYRRIFDESISLHIININQFLMQQIIFHPQVEEIIIHSDYAADSSDYNIALLKLAEEATLSDRIQLMQLPASSAPADMVCAVSGWGTTSNTSFTQPSALHATRVDIKSNIECQQIYNAIGWDITDRMVCAAKEGCDSCSVSYEFWC